HHIDPDADTVITLRISSKRCAPWTEQQEATSSKSDKIRVKVPPPATPAPPSDEPSKSEERRIEYHVSSKHLKLASRWFKRAMGTETFLESSRSHEDNLYHVSAEDWDEDAFLFLMNALHLQQRKIPRPITLEMLAKIAMVVDYYDCGETLAYFAETWAVDAKANNDIPEKYCRDLVLWIWVSWVFKLEGDFKMSTEIALKQLNKGELSAWGLPIPDRILGELKTRRIQTIEAMIAGLHRWRDKFRSGSYQCPSGDSFFCGSILLGALDKQMHAMGLVSPSLQSPFENTSLAAVGKKVNSIQSPVWYPH
ncbi:hypothetical protein BDV96DRAFT_459735, partial [Lophiotrema nucula]